MTAVLCLCDNGGMSFGGKRQSRDKLLYNEILKLVGNATLYVNEYSASLFNGVNVAVTDDFLSVAGTENYCFIERAEDAFVVKEADTVIIYRWNRRYPFDQSFDFNLLSSKKLVSKRNFSGNSHEKITEEIYQ